MPSVKVAGKIKKFPYTKAGKKDAALAQKKNALNKAVPNKNVPNKSVKKKVKS